MRIDLRAAVTISSWSPAMRRAWPPPWPTGLRGETGVTVDLVPADLTDAQDLARIERRLREDARIGVLVNNAGTTIRSGFLNQGSEDLSRLLALNVTAVTRLANAAASRFVKAGEGAIINLASVVGLAPEFGSTVYGATKAFVLFLSQGLSLELASKGVYVQAVLPAAVRTQIWEYAGKDVNAIPGVMEVNELVDAALVGFDRRELITIPPLHDATQWSAFEVARRAMLPNFAQAVPAERYRSAA